MKGKKERESGRAGERTFQISNLKSPDPAGFCGRALDNVKRERETREKAQNFACFA
jgi:hypothetical protein